MEVMTCHQLTPELAEDIAGASLVVMVDAADDGSPPGSVERRVVRAGTSPAGSHDFGPAAVVALAQELYQVVPPVVLVTVAVGGSDLGEALSPAVEAAVPVAVAAVLDVIRDGAVD